MDNPFARKKGRGPDAGDCCCFADAAHDGNRAAEPVRTLRRLRDQRPPRTRIR